MRYYLNNFADGPKQDGIDLMLGRYRCTHTDKPEWWPFPDARGHRLMGRFRLVMLF
jgi:hypothetical protein